MTKITRSNKSILTNHQWVFCRSHSRNSGYTTLSDTQTQNFPLHVLQDNYHEAVESFADTTESHQQLLQKNVIHKNMRKETFYASGHCPGLNAGMRLNLQPKFKEKFYVASLSFRATAVITEKKFTKLCQKQQYLHQKQKFSQRIHLNKTATGFALGLIKSKPVSGYQFAETVGSETSQPADTLCNNAEGKIKVKPDFVKASKPLLDPYCSGYFATTTKTQWISVLSSFAGCKSGWQWIPRARQKVILLYQHGISHRPLVVGTVPEDDTFQTDHLQRFGFKTGNPSNLKPNHPSENALYLNESPNNKTLQFLTTGDLSLKVKGRRKSVVQKNRDIKVIHGNYLNEVQGNFQLKANKKIILKVHDAQLIISQKDIIISADKIEFI